MILSPEARVLHYSDRLQATSGVSSEVFCLVSGARIANTEPLIYQFRGNSFTNGCFVWQSYQPFKITFQQPSLRTFKNFNPLKKCLTFLLHVDIQTLLEPAGLALVPPGHVHDTSPILLAHVVKIPEVIRFINTTF